MKLHEFKKKDEEVWVRPKPCCICKKMLKGAYGHTTIGDEVVWSCSATCEKSVTTLRSRYYGGQHDSIPRAAPAEAFGN